MVMMDNNKETKDDNNMIVDDVEEALEAREKALAAATREEELTNTTGTTSSQVHHERPTLTRKQTLTGMQLNCYRIDPTSDDGRLNYAPLDHAIDRRKEVVAKASSFRSRHSSSGSLPPPPHPLDTEDPSYWIDANVKDGEDAIELQKIIQEMGLSTFMQSHLSKANQIETPQVLCLPKAVFMVMRVFPPEEDVDSLRDQRYVAALAVQGLLLTVSTFPRTGDAAYAGQELNISTRKSVEQRPLPEPSTSGALTLWLLQHVRRVAASGQTLRKSCFAVDEALDQGIETVVLEDLVDLKNQINLHLAVCEEQLECLEAVKEGSSMSDGLDFSRLPGSFGLILSTAGANERMALRLEKKVADLRTIYDSHRQDRINHRLEVLTIVSAIFLPLTLMAGIWGMNFTNMPELHKENAYYIAIASMAAVAIGQLCLFWRSGWFS